MIVCPALVDQIVVTFGSRVSRGNDVDEGEEICEGIRMTDR